MMSWDGFVIDQTAQAKLRHAFDAQRYLEHPGPRAVRSRRGVIGGRIGLPEARERLSDDGRFRTAVEQCGRALLGVPQYRFDIGHDDLSSVFRIRILQVLPKPGNAIVHGTLRPAEASEDGVHFHFDPRHLAQSDLMDLVCRQAGGREAPKIVGIGLGSVLEAPDAGVVGCTALKRFQQSDGFPPGGINLCGDDLLGFSAKLFPL